MTRKGGFKQTKEWIEKMRELHKKLHRIKNYGFQKGNKVGRQFKKGMSAPPTAFKKGEIGWRRNKRPPLTEKHKNKLRKIFSGENNPNWKNGKSFEPYPSDWIESLREAIRKRDNYTCQICEIHQDELEGRFKKLAVHHIDYDKDNLNPENLISLCKGCHSKTNFNRDYWINYFKSRIK